MATVLLVLAVKSSGPSTRLAEMWTARGSEDTELRWTTSVLRTHSIRKSPKTAEPDQGLGTHEPCTWLSCEDAGGDDGSELPREARRTGVFMLIWIVMAVGLVVVVAGGFVGRSRTAARREQSDHQGHHHAKGAHNSRGRGRGR
jgi:hypothetical protein